MRLWDHKNLKYRMDFVKLLATLTSFSGPMPGTRFVVSGLKLGCG